MDDEKLHWYLFSYNGPSHFGSSGERRNSYISTGYSKKGVTCRMMNNNKAAAGLDLSADIIAVSYLGHMTEAEFNG